MNKEYVKILFDRIGTELRIPANLIICERHKAQQYLGWVETLRGANFIFVNLELLKEKLAEAKAVNGVLWFDDLSSWLQVRNIKIALFCVIVHEYTHLCFQGYPDSPTGLTESDYFDLLKPLGTRAQIMEVYNRPEAKEELFRRKTWEEKIHDDAFYTRLRLNIYRCGNILEEIQADGD
ncbi:MAG TPA: hypothetical protein DCK76_10390 [Desulfotomaculum sp.]|nr:hypothetical protein [Desulfotomaculum sp.]HBY03049.1 hypothetical protein [Desulfotomaculum sp.]